MVLFSISQYSDIKSVCKEISSRSTTNTKKDKSVNLEVNLIGYWGRVVEESVLLSAQQLNTILKRVDLFDEVILSLNRESVSLLEYFIREVEIVKLTIKLCKDMFIEERIIQYALQYSKKTLFSPVFDFSLESCLVEYVFFRDTFKEELETPFILKCSNEIFYNLSIRAINFCNKYELVHYSLNGFKFEKQNIMKNIYIFQNIKKLNIFHLVKGNSSFVVLMLVIKCISKFISCKSEITFGINFNISTKKEEEEEEERFKFLLLYMSEAMVSKSKILVEISCSEYKILFKRLGSLLHSRKLNNSYFDQYGTRIKYTEEEIIKST